MATIRTTAKGRMAGLLRGDVSVYELDDEELMTGMLRDKSGTLRDGGNDLVPAEMHREIMRRTLQYGTERLRTHYYDAIETLSEVMKSEHATPADKIRAANIIIERVAGKATQTVDLTVTTAKYEEIATSIFRDIPDEIEAEIVDEKEQEGSAEAQWNVNSTSE